MRMATLLMKGENSPFRKIVFLTTLLLWEKDSGKNLSLLITIIIITAEISVSLTLSNLFKCVIPIFPLHFVLFSFILFCKIEYALINYILTTCFKNKTMDSNHSKKQISNELIFKLFFMKNVCYLYDEHIISGPAGLEK